jgi:hypothetical protein
MTVYLSSDPEADGHIELASKAVSVLVEFRYLCA